MKILLAVDDAKSAEAIIRVAISQLRREGAQVLVLHVLDWSNFMPSPFPEVGAEPMYSTRQLETIIAGETEKARALVDGAAESLRSAGFEATTTVREGDPKVAILDCAAEWQADLIMLGSHGRKGIARFVLGSVSEAVARYARCSVEIVRPGSSRS